MLKRNKLLKRITITAGIVFAIVALIAFNRITSTRGKVILYAEANEDDFEISVSNSGELTAERSIEIKGPQMAQGRRNMGGGGHNNMRMMELKIQDIVPEGTMVKEGDYIAQMDRTQYDNTLKDEREKLQKEQETLEMKLLDCLSSEERRTLDRILAKLENRMAQCLNRAKSARTPSLLSWRHGAH